MYKKYFKRLIDFLLSFIGILIGAPIILIIVLLIKLDSKGPIIFKQKRVGQGEKYFDIYKFRTMRTDTPSETPTHMLENPDQFITRIGKYLRKYSLDEIPQLFNILKGDMAVIGPRPALWNQFDLLNQRKRYGISQVRPGLTGWAQIKGRDELTIIEKVALDGEYVEKMSFLFDARCFIGTITVVFRHAGVQEGGTMHSIKDE